MKKRSLTVIILIIISAFIALVPIFTQKGSEFGGSDDAGSEMISEITGEETDPWFSPVLETMIRRRAPRRGGKLILLYTDRHRSWHNSIFHGKVRGTKKA